MGLKEMKLIIVDVQNDIVDPTGAMYRKDFAAIVPKIDVLIDQAIANNDSIVAFKDTHEASDWLESDNKTMEAKRTLVHCVNNTKGHNYPEPLQQKILNEGKGRPDVLFLKKSTFQDVDVLLDAGRNGGWISDEKDEWTVVGLFTDICVLNTALALRNKRTMDRVIVNASACAGTTPDHHRMALEILKRNCIEVIDNIV
jgi:nicotinamidase-related amidase